MKKIIVILLFSLLSAVQYGITRILMKSRIDIQSTERAVNMKDLPYDLTNLKSIEDDTPRLIRMSREKVIIESEYFTILGNVLISSAGEYRILERNENNAIVHASMLGTRIITTFIDGGLQILYEMKDKNSPKEIVFDLVLTEGSIIEITENNEYVVIDSNGKIELLIGQPWAIDSKGNFIETHYKIEGNQIIQTIHYEGDNYPLIADPLFCTNSIDNDLTIWDSTYSEGRGTLTVYPTTCAKIYLASMVLYAGTFLLVSPFLLIESSSIVSDMYDEMTGDSSYQSHVASWQADRIADQFSCHAFNPAIQLLQKYPWNLEPWRPDVSLVQTFIDGCNPPLN